VNHRVRRWPLFFIAAPAAVAVWSGWVGLGGMCGFGIVHPLPGIVDSLTINTAITLPIGVESYGAYALGAWLTPGTTETVRKFARRSAIGSLCLGVLGQVAYHLLAAAHQAEAPWPVTVFVACLPVVTLGFGAALTHLLRDSVAPETGNETVPAADETVQATEPEEATGRTDGGTGVQTLVAPEEADETVQDEEPEVVPEPEPEPENPQASSLPAAVPTDAERAAEIAMRTTVVAGNPFSASQLQRQFRLTRSEATKVRNKVLADMAVDDPEEEAAASPAA
jgi:hypothetical protein